MKDKLINALLNQKEIFGDELFSREIKTGVLNYEKNETHSSESDEKNEMIFEQTYEFEKIKSLEELNKTINACRKCSLSKSKTNYVFGKGNPNADIMLIGEAPGAEEDRSGEPFVGRAGKLLTNILSAVNFSREEIFIANILKCRPPNNRDPLPEEREMCMPFLLKQIELIKPKLILCLGRIAATTLLNKKESLTKMRGEVFDFMGIKLMVTYHPAALLRNPNWKRPVWEDIQKFRKLYDELTAS